MARVEGEEAREVGRVVLMGVEAGREYDQIGRERTQRRREVAVKRGHVLGGGRAARERHVDEPRLALEDGRGLGIEEMLRAVDGAVHDLRPVADDLLRAVAVVEVDVDDRDAADRHASVLEQRVLRRDRRVVEQAEALPAAVLDVVGVRRRDRRARLARRRRRRLHRPQCRCRRRPTRRRGRAAPESLASARCAQSCC